MLVFKSNVQPSEVFSPRGEYNSDMYVNRPDYEREFADALETDLCIVIHGQSGTGKTWLTRRMLEKGEIYYKVVNLAGVATGGSIDSCFQQIMSREKWEIRSSRSETMSANITAGVAGGQLEATKVFENKVDYFYEFLKFMRHRAQDRNKKRYIVFENMEAILDDSELIKQLANLITLVDDDEIAKFKTKFIIIGATKDIHQYLIKVNNVNTISNRICELRDITTLTVTQAKELMRRGFEKVDIKFESNEIKDWCIEEYTRVTGAVPQRIHELCLVLAQNARRSTVNIGEKQINEAIGKWISTSLNKNYTYISRLLEQNKSSNSLKLRVLYAISQIDSLYFYIENIEKEMDKNFPVYEIPKNETIQEVIDGFCQCEPPLLVKTEDYFGEYSFEDYKCALCLRVILYNDKGKVYRKNITEI